MLRLVGSPPVELIVTSDGDAKVPNVLAHARDVASIASEICDNGIDDNNNRRMDRSTTF